MHNMPLLLCGHSVADSVALFIGPSPRSPRPPARSPPPPRTACPRRHVHPTCRGGQRPRRNGGPRSAAVPGMEGGRCAVLLTVRTCVRSASCVALSVPACSRLVCPLRLGTGMGRAEGTNQRRSCMLFDANGISYFASRHVVPTACWYRLDLCLEAHAGAYRLERSAVRCMRAPPRLGRAFTFFFASNCHAPGLGITHALSWRVTYVPWLPLAGDVPVSVGGCILFMRACTPGCGAAVCAPRVV